MFEGESLKNENVRSDVGFAEEQVRRYFILIRLSLSRSFVDFMDLANLV